MSETPQRTDTVSLDQLADKFGVAIALVDEHGRQIGAVNDNSICRSLNPGDEFSPDCARFCGRVFDKAHQTGKTVGYVCHAGLDCRAIPAASGQTRFVTIVGRSFLKSENYRQATERAIIGDWRKYPPAEFFENILLTGSATVLDNATRQVKEMLVNSGGAPPAKAVPQEYIPAEVVTDTRPAAIEPPQPPANTAPEVPPKPETKDPAKLRADASAWRSFFGSILKNDYPRATASILRFLAQHYGFTTLLWFERRGDRFESTTGSGEAGMKNRRVRLGIPPGDARLVGALQSDMPLELGERSNDPAANGSRVLCLFPIGVDGEVSAAIAILDSIGSDKMKRHIARICHSISPQLEILRLRSEAAHRERLADAVRTFGESLKQIDNEDFWQNLTQETAEILRAERASLLILDEKSGGFEIKALVGAKKDLTPGEAPGARVARIVFARNEAVVVADVAKTGLLPAPAERNYKTSSFLSCPVIVGSRTIGVMSFTDRASGEPFNQQSFELFEAIAPQLAVAIDHAVLKEKAGEFEQLSVTDALTGLLNRRYIEARLAEEVKRSNRHGFPMSFMMLDVDHFKSYNDQFGHPAGDDALRLVGHVIRETLRGADVAARFGGEEFSILLPQTTGEEAATIAERIRVNLEETRFPHRSVTASIGVASCSAELCVSADLISAADKALYEAKRRGRNRVMTFETLYGVPAV